MNLSFSSYHPGLIHSFLRIILVQNDSVARDCIHFVPQTVVVVCCIKLKNNHVNWCILYNSDVSEKNKVNCPPNSSNDRCLLSCINPSYCIWYKLKKNVVDNETKVICYSLFLGGSWQKCFIFVYIIIFNKNIFIIIMYIYCMR